VKYFYVFVLLVGLIGCSENKNPFIEFVENKTADEIFAFSGELFFEECNKNISSTACRNKMIVVVKNLNKNGYINIHIDQINNASISMFLSKVKLSDKAKNKKSLDPDGSDIFKS